MPPNALDTKGTGQGPQGKLYFSYHTLGNPPKGHKTKKAEVQNRCLKFHGDHPILCRGSSTVTRVAWYIFESEMAERRRIFVSEECREAPVRVELRNESAQSAMTFVWDGDEDDLTEKHACERNK